MAIVRSLSYIDEIGEVTSDNRVKAAALIIVPAGITLTASYLITKAAYPKDFSLLKWIAIPAAISLISFASFFATRFVVGPLEEEYTGEI